MNTPSMIQGLVPVLAAIAGGLLTFMGTTAQQTRARAADRRGLLREKIEEIYILSNKLDEYVLFRMHDMTRTQIGLSEEKETSPEPENPMPRLLMLTKIYASKLSGAACELDEASKAAQNAAQKFYLKIAEAKSPLSIEEFEASLKPVDDVQERTEKFRQLIEAHIQQYV
jgi:hypothetical protein